MKPIKSNMKTRIFILMFLTSAIFNLCYSGTFKERSTDKDFPYTLNTPKKEAKIKAANHPEFTFLLPEMAGNLKFAIVRKDKSKWFCQFKTSTVKQTNKGLLYTLYDPLLEGGKISIEIITLSNTEGIVIEVSTHDLPEDTSLFWSYGGGYGKVLAKEESYGLVPSYCKYNVFSVEWTAFTSYYGENHNLKTINAVAPVSSEIRLSDAHKQQSPLIFFESGKKTNAPALTALLPLKNGQKEYFCIYRQNEKADYNHYMLPALFNNEK